MANKCKNCGSTEIDVDPARGDAVCTNCGSVLEDSVIVSEIQFEENAHGGNSALGHFVSSDSHGGAIGLGGSFHAGLGRESREITLAKAKRTITNVAQQLRINQHCIDTAHNFYKMALTRNLTKGRRNAHVVAACLYMTCRVEGTPHLLIDFSDVLQICVYELGRTYLRLSQALCISIPSMDPCLYILRFAHRLEFGEKTHDVSMTALALVKRMKRDFIHIGRRPSGLCGAALLMAARLHEFSRTVTDIVKIVKVHESTLRKRLMEFGETPSSLLTLEEFMKIDLEEEQDPPSFKAARKRDEERLQEMMEEASYASKFNELQHEIELLLDKKTSIKRKRNNRCNTETEERETQKFILQSTLGAIGECLGKEDMQENAIRDGLGPNIDSMGLATSMDQAPGTEIQISVTNEESEEIDLSGIDDDEINSYIMTESEAKYKDCLWSQVNAEYLKEQKEKEERLAKEKEEGKPEKKKRKTAKRPEKNIVASTPGEAIQKMLQTKKISNKINYDVLESLHAKDSDPKIETSNTSKVASSGVRLEPRKSIASYICKSTRKKDCLSQDSGIGISQSSSILSQNSDVEESQSSLFSQSTQQLDLLSQDLPSQSSGFGYQTEPSNESEKKEVEEEEYDDDDDDDEEPEEEQDSTQVSLAQMLNNHQNEDMYDDGDYYDEY